MEAGQEINRYLGKGVRAMKELTVQYCYSLGKWGIYCPDNDDIIYVHASMEKVVAYAYGLAELIKPCKVKLIPQYLLNSYTLACYGT